MDVNVTKNHSLKSILIPIPQAGFPSECIRNKCVVNVWWWVPTGSGRRMTDQHIKVGKPKLCTTWVDLYHWAFKRTTVCPEERIALRLLSLDLFPGSKIVVSPQISNNLSPLWIHHTITFVHLLSFLSMGTRPTLRDSHAE